MTTYYHAVSGTRFLDATRIDLSLSDDANISGFSDDDLIVAVHFQDASTGGKDPTTQAWSLEWENTTDAAGTWTALGNTGELTYNATTNLVDTTTLTVANWACSVAGGLTNETDGVEREGSNADITIDLAADAETEFQIAVDFSGADKANGDQYSFRIVDSTESQTIALTPKVTVTTAGGDITVTPAVQTVTASVPPPSIRIDASPVAALMLATAAALAVVVSIPNDVTAAVTGVTASVPPPSIRIDVAPDPVTVTCGIPPPGVDITASVTITPAVQTVTASALPPVTEVAVQAALNEVTASVLSSLVLDLLSVVTPGGGNTLTVTEQAPTVTMSGSVDVTPAVLSITASVSPPVPLVDVSPAVQAATASVNPPTPSIAVSASTLDITASLPTVAIRLDSVQSPAVQTVTATVLPPTVDTSTNVTIQPVAQTVSATFYWPPKVVISSSVAPGALTITATVQPPIPAVAVAISTLDVTASLPASSVRLDTVQSPAVQTVTATVLPPTVVIPGAVTIEPIAQTVTASVLPPTPAIALVPSVLDVTASVPAPTPVIGVSPSVLTVTASVNPPTPAVAIAASTLDLTASLPASGIRLDSVQSPAAQTITATVLAPSLVISSSITPAVLGLTATVQPPNVSAGVIVVPAESDVRSGVPFEEGSLPAEGDVRLGISYGAEGVEFTGTLVVPIESNVRDGIGYGAGGTEYTGTLVVPDYSSVTPDAGRVQQICEALVALLDAADGASAFYEVIGSTRVYTTLSDLSDVGSAVVAVVAPQMTKRKRNSNGTYGRYVVVDILVRIHLTNDATADRTTMDNRAWLLEQIDDYLAAEANSDLTLPSAVIAEYVEPTDNRADKDIRDGLGVLWDSDDLLEKRQVTGLVRVAYWVDEDY